MIEQFASPAAQLLLTPFLLRQLSAEQFALWVVALTFLLGAPTLSRGTSMALLTVLPRLSGGDGHKRARLLVGRAIRVTVVTSVGVAAVVLTLTAIVLYLNFGPPISFVYVVLVLALLALAEIESTLTFALKSRHRFRQTAMIELLGRLLQIGATLAVVHKSSSAAVPLAVVVATIAAKLACKAFAWRALVADAAGPPSVGAAAATGGAWQADVNRLGFWSWIHVVSGVAFYAFDRWATGLLAGAAALSAYAVCSQLAQLAHAVPAAAGQLLIPWVSSRQAHAGDRRALKLDLRAVATSGTLFACLPSLALLVLGRPILEAWISPSFADENTGLLNQLTIVFMVLAASVTCFQLLVGLGHMRYAATLTFVSSAIYMTCVVLVAPSSPVAMAHLKLIYAGAALLFIAKFGQAWRRL